MEQPSNPGQNLNLSRHIPVMLGTHLSLMALVREDAYQMEVGQVQNRNVSEVMLSLSLVMRKSVFGFPTRSDTNRAVQPRKMARGLKFRI